LITAEIAAAPAMLTDLYLPFLIALVDPTTSVSPINQSSGMRR
jgi:hypothetical protein